jgi:ribose transport system substrate-binding protein
MKELWKNNLMKKSCLYFLIVAILVIVLQLLAISQEKLRIAVIPKGESALFWKAIHAGAKLGATAASGVEIMWKSPFKEDNAEQQISILDKCISENVSGIILSPIHQNALTESVSKAMKGNIPVLIFDSALKGTPGKDFISFVGINNRDAGARAGEHLAKLLDGKGKVVLLRFVKNQANTTEREEGFLESMAMYHNIQVTIKDRYAGGTVDEVKKTCKSILGQLSEANGIFCPNELSTTGMLLTLREANLAGKIKFVGFDTPAPVVDALKKGEIDALIAQDPARMGFQSIKTIVDYIRGKKISSTVDIGVKIITRENLNTPEIQKLLVLPSIVE